MRLDCHLVYLQVPDLWEGALVLWLEGHQHLHTHIHTYTHTHSTNIDEVLEKWATCNVKPYSAYTFAVECGRMVPLRSCTQKAEYVALHMSLNPPAICGGRWKPWPSDGPVISHPYYSPLWQRVKPQNLNAISEVEKTGCGSQEIFLRQKWKKKDGYHPVSLSIKLRWL